jgi:hypothetical protein
MCEAKITKKCMPSHIMLWRHGYANRKQVLHLALGEFRGAPTSMIRPLRASASSLRGRLSVQDLRGRPLRRLLPRRAALPCSLLGAVVRLAAALLNSQPGAVVRDALPGSLRGMSEEGTGVPSNCSSGGGTGTAAVPAQQTAAGISIPW